MGAPKSNESHLDAIMIPHCSLIPLTRMARVGTLNNISSKTTDSVDSSLINTLDHVGYFLKNKKVRKEEKNRSRCLFSERAFIYR